MRTSGLPVIAAVGLDLPVALGRLVVFGVALGDAVPWDVTAMAGLYRSVRHRLPTSPAIMRAIAFLLTLAITVRTIPFLNLAEDLGNLIRRLNSRLSARSLGHGA